MRKLMKYEFRKTMFSKMILLVITVIVEIAFLAGVFLEWEKGLAIGMFGLILCASVGIIYIGIQSISIFHKDLNTKQSYMLFLTPKNSYQVLGAKTLENGISLILVGICFAALAAIDVSTAVLYIGGLEEFLDLLETISVSIRLEIDLSAKDVVLTFFTTLVSWLQVVQTGYLAVVLSATVLAGRKFSGFVSFILFILISWLCSWPAELLPEMENRYLAAGSMIGITFLIVAVMYAVTGWIMERKLNV